MQRFLRDERGAITLEFTVLVPFFVLLLVFFADATIIYLTHSELFNVARDVSRRMSTGELQTEADVEAYAANHLYLGGRNHYVWVDFADDKTVSLVVTMSDASIFGLFFQPIIGKSLVATATMTEEPRM